MHKLTSKPITMDCFEIDDFNKDIKFFGDEGHTETDGSILPYVNGLIKFCEMLRSHYVVTKDVAYWKELVRWLPEAWLQTRTVTMNYENLLAICSKSQRRFHKLNEWSGQTNENLTNFIAWARTLPYAQELIFIDELETPEEKLLAAFKNLFGFNLFNLDGIASDWGKCVEALKDVYNKMIAK